MTTSKTYVLDTTVLIEDPDVMYKLGNSLIVIPMAVIKELDGLKRSDVGSVAQAARAVARTLDRLGSYGDLREGVKLSSGGVLKVYNGSETVDGLASEADNRIVGAAVRLQREVSNVTLLTTDGNMRTVARVNGVKAEIMGVSYERTVKKEIEMDKYRMEVERLKERGKIVKKKREVKTTLKERIFRIGTFIVKACFVMAIVGILSIPFVGELLDTQIISIASFFILLFGIAIMIVIYIFFSDHISTGSSDDFYLRNPVTNPGYSDMRGNIWHQNNEDN